MEIAATDIIRAPWLSLGAWTREITDEFEAIRQRLLAEITAGLVRDRVATYENAVTVILCSLLAPQSQVYRWRSSRSHRLDGGEFDNPAEITQTQVIATMEAALRLGWVQPIDFNLVNDLIPGKAANRFALTDACPTLQDPLIITYHPNSSFVFCKRDPLFEGFENEEGNWGYTDQEVEEDRDMLRRFNALIADTTLSLDGRVLPHSRPLRRLFKEDERNANVYLNGRFFGGAWQNLRKDDRPRLTIDGQPTAELDFSAMFPRALYHSININYQEDPYEMGELNRKLWKAIFQIALNTSKHGRAKALRNKLDADFIDNVELREQVERVYDAPRRYFEKLQALHQPLVPHLYHRRTSDQLMWRESLVAKRLLKWALHNNVSLLPIHDSFIVSQNQRENLEASMRMSYWDEFGFNPVIR